MADTERRPEEQVRYRDPEGKFVPAPDAGRDTERRRNWSRTIKEMAKTYTIEALGTILDIMRDDTNKANIRLHAAEVILAYGWGRPAALTWNDDQPTNPLLGYSTRELQVLLVKAIEKEPADNPVIDTQVEEKEDDENEER